MTIIHVVKRDGRQEPLQIEKIHKVTEWATEGLDVSQSELEMEAHLMFYDGIKTAAIHESLTRAASTLITKENPDYTFVAARLLLQRLYKDVTNGIEYPHLDRYIHAGIVEGRLNPALKRYDLIKLDAAIDKTRDLQFTYLGLQTLVDRYLIREQQQAGKIAAPIIELPQHFWMRVAMGLALNEIDRDDRAIEFYNALSRFEFLSSTPTLFNAGTNHSQLSSCYLNTVEDSIDGIYGTIHECANLSKFAGGIGTDWTRVRGQGDPIRGTNGTSSGVIPYLKVFNDTAVAVNQGGKRLGAFAAYLEPWHTDLYAFCDLKKNSGDDRRRAHDIFPALWMPDLFFKRVEADGDWSFFSPNEFPELHELHGQAFEERYEHLEIIGAARSREKASVVWRKILTSLFETGHPWITFKDECNRRNPQDHAGVIHSSNLCTEITLNTSDTETAVCNLGSINLSRVPVEDFERVTATAVRMLDNVIDLNYYPSDKARRSNMLHRSIGLGVMGYAEWLVQNGIAFDSEEHITQADYLFEDLSYHVIKASVDLAKERGRYATFDGSKWSRGLLPIDTAHPGAPLTNDFEPFNKWDRLRDQIQRHGIRNSNLMAIAPTATISLIAGTTQCIEPVFRREYIKSNLSGSFIVVDPTLKYERDDLCKEAFEIDPLWVIKAAAARQKWIDQSQSVNIFVNEGITGQVLENIYMTAWKMGLKTTYYLRSQSVQVASPILSGNTIESVVQANQSSVSEEGETCSINNPDCESCQ